MTANRRTRSEAAALAALLFLLSAPASAQGSAAPDVSLTAVAVVAVAGAMVVAVTSLILALAAWTGARRRERRDGARIRELEDATGRRVAVLDTAPGGRFEWAASSGLETCSSGLAQLLGAPPVAANAFRDLAAYFDPADYPALDAAAAALRSGGTPFDLAVRTAAGLALEARGRRVAGAGGTPQAHVIWFRDMTAARRETAAIEEAAAQVRGQRDRLQEVLDHAPFPAWWRQPDLSIGWANHAYCAAVEADLEVIVRDSIEFVPGAPPKQSRALAAMARQTGAAQTDHRRFAVAGERRTYEITEIPLSGDETAGIARDVTGREDAMNELRRHTDAHADVMDRLASAIVIFGPDKRLIFFNESYARLWALDEDWLEARPTHGEILEALREARRIPEQVDFPAYKATVMEQYSAVLEPQEEQQHLPDGRTLRVVTAPHPFGGLLFIYEDVSDRLELERSRNTLEEVQRATLDHLFEGVAVFGSDGRLKLFNPGYARIWDLDQAFLSAQPHVSEVAERCRALFRFGEGKTGWQAVKEKIVTRTLDRTARMARLNRPDGKVIEYASVPLPDGNTLYTYFDVTDGVRIGASDAEPDKANARR